MSNLTFIRKFSVRLIRNNADAGGGPVYGTVLRAATSDARLLASARGPEPF